MFCKLVGGIFVVVKVGNSCGRGEICKFIKGIGSCWRKGNFFNFNLCGEIFFWDYIFEYYILYNFNF